MNVLPLKTCQRCLGRGRVLRNAGTGLTGRCPAKGCTAKARADVADGKINGHAKEAQP